MSTKTNPKSMITVANVRTYRGDMRHAAFVGRPTVYGNPFRVAPNGQDRKWAIDNFRGYWYAEAQQPLRDRACRELGNGRIDVLLCWCPPLPCHANVIAEFLNNLRLING